MAKKNDVRVRFAPSPTGNLHLGGARTALFNWLFAKHNNGTFILRLEDTDRSRSTEEATKSILDGLEWLGLYWDEGPNVEGEAGPYRQTERLHIYGQYAERLLREGKAYHCFCQPAELEEKRKQAEARKEAPRYDGKCRKLADSEISSLRDRGVPSVIRFRLPATGDTFVNDLVRGKVAFKNELLDDFVIMKSDKFPTYNFAAVVDDSLMEITHVIRGDDHLSNTPRQLLLYQALGLTPPAFAHIPMILGPDKTRLSKRHGATSVFAYSDMGYLPEAMVNYLAKLGWGHKDEEIFSREDLIAKFSLEGINRSPAVFNIEKLTWLNGHYMRLALPERILDLAMPNLEKAFPNASRMERTKDGQSYIARAISCVQDRIRVIPDVPDLISYFLTESVKYDREAREKYLRPEAAPLLLKLRGKLSSLSDFSREEIEKVFKGLAEELSVKLGEIIHPTRAALTGRTASPGIYEVVNVLGRDRTLARLDEALTALKP